MASRPTLIAGLVGIATIVAIGLYAVLAPGTTEDTSGTGDAEPVSPPTIVPLDPHEATATRHARPWPFEAFAEDIDRAGRPAREGVHRKLQARREEIAGHWDQTRFSITVIDQRLQDIMPVLAAHFTHTSTEVFTQPPYFEDELRFSLDLTDVTLTEVVNRLTVQSDDRLQARIVPRGIVIETRNAVMDAEMAVREWAARMSERKAPVDEPLLSVEYRADFEGAHIGAVIRDIREKTGVEVIVGLQLWGRAVKLDWHSDPVPLMDALDALAKRLRGNWYWYEGRVFLLAR